jgi:protease IV
MRILFALVANVLLLLVHPLRMLRRAYAARRGAFVEIVIDGPVVEVPHRATFLNRRGPTLALESVRDVISTAGVDPRVQGFLFRFKSFQAATATATSLRDVILAARATQKRVVAYLPHGGGTLATYVASAAERVLVGPETHLELLGFAVEAPYVKGALDLAGIEPEVFAKGQYKTAGEFLVANEMSAPQKEQVGALLDVAYDVVTTGLSQGRQVPVEQVRSWIDRGAWSAANAIHVRIVDAVCYEDELATALDGTRPNGAPLVSAQRYLRRRRPRFVRFFPPPYIAVVEVSGPIVSGRPLSLVPIAADDAITRTLRGVAEDSRAKGVVISISSRGGSALASDRILHAVRKLGEKKPIIAYLGDVAASGGYMIAIGAPRIIAQEATITGSIGVIAARMVLGPLLAKVGIMVEVVKRGERADSHSPIRHFTEPERADFQLQLDEIYRSFLSVVALGRKKSVEEIEPLAGGRVWSGRHALAHGLVDRLGGFDVALGEMRSQLGPRGQTLQPIVVGSERMERPRIPIRLVNTLARGLGIEPLLDAATLALDERSGKAWLWCHARMRDLGQN